MAHITVWTGRGHWSININVLEHYLPLIAEHIAYGGGFVKLPELAEQLTDYLPERISYNSILGTLKSLFGILKQPQIAFEGLGHRIEYTLSNTLQKDLYSFKNHKGLLQCRNRFVTLAGFAAMLQSLQVGHTLVRFFWRERREIMSYERTRFLHEWASAIQGLQGLVSHKEINRCLHYLARRRDDIRSNYHNSGLNDPAMDYIINILYSLSDKLDRGRQLERPMYLPDMPRARTMPPLIHYHRSRSPHPQYLLGPPDSMAVGFPSPSPSMDAALQNGYIGNEIEILKMRQDMLEDKVDQIQFDALDPLPLQLR